MLKYILITGRGVWEWTEKNFNLCVIDILYNLSSEITLFGRIHFPFFTNKQTQIHGHTAFDLHRCLNPEFADFKAMP